MISRQMISLPSRTTVATVLLAGLLLSAGCLGFITGSSPLSVSAKDVSVSDSALSESEYEKLRDEKVGFNTSISVADQERRVEATNHLQVYQREVKGDIVPVEIDVPLTRFMVLSTPKAEIAGQTMNPLGEKSTSEILEWISKNSDSKGSLSDFQLESNRSVQSLGEKRTVSKFSATMEVQGVGVPVTVHTATFAHEDDFITVISVHPKALDEQQRIDRMLENLEHPAN